MNEKTAEALNVIQNALNALGVENTISDDFSEVNGSIFETIVLTAKGKELYRGVLPVNGDPAIIKQNAIDQQAKFDAQAIEAKAKTDDIIAAVDAALAEAVEKSSK